MADERTLTVFCRAGLSNRVRVLVSAMALSEASGRRLRMFWPRTRQCGAPYRTLFANDWPVIDVEALDPALATRQVEGWSYRAAPRLLADGPADIAVGINSWLVPPDLTARPEQYTRYRELLGELTPQPALRDRIDEFRARHFRPPVIGVHLRRGDFLRLRPASARNTSDALAAVDRLLAEAPHALIFLCTDDGARDGKQVVREGLEEIFRGRYGDRVISAPHRTLERRTVEGIQDAVVDLWLLRATDMVVGTYGSSFSNLAVFGRDVPHALAGAVTGRGVLDRVPVVRWFVRQLRRRVVGPLRAAGARRPGASR